MERNTIKGHGFKVGDRVDYYGRDESATDQADRTILGKEGTVYILTVVGGQFHGTQVAKFGAATKIWAEGVADESEGFYTVAGDATKVARGHGAVSVPMYEAPEVTRELPAAYDMVTADEIATAVATVRQNGRVFTAEAHNFAPDQAFIRAVEAGDLTVIYDLCPDMNRYVLAGHEPVNVVRIAPNIVRVVAPTVEIHTDSEVITEAEVWAGTDTTITPGAKTLMNRRARKSSKRKNTRVNSRRVKGGF